jgi:hypothetical protein
MQCVLFNQLQVITWVEVAADFSQPSTGQTPSQSATSLCSLTLLQQDLNPNSTHIQMSEQHTNV